MTHLRIEQNNIQENVSSAVIAKLYELATSGDLDLSSNLAGNLHTTATYLEYIDAITGEFPELTISSDNFYIMFTDPEVKRVMATLFGNGTNVSAPDLIGVTEIPQYLFKDNLSIRTFDELNNLRGITTIGREAFAGCTNLTSINTGNITELGGNNGAMVFNGCSSLSSLDLHSLVRLGSKCFNGTNITNLTLPAITYIYEGFSFNDKITKVDFGENLTQIGALTFWGSAITTIIFRGNTPPYFSDTLRGDKFKYDLSNLTIYVPDAKISDYQTALPGVASCITGISNLPQS